MEQSPILPLLFIIIIEISIFLVLVRFVPHLKPLDQAQWKVAILFAVGTLLLWQIIMLGIWVSLFISSSQNDTIRPLLSLFWSLFLTILVSICLGIFSSIIIFGMVYWSLKFRPWLSYDLQLGASLFDKLSEHIIKIVKRIHLSH